MGVDDFTAIFAGIVTKIVAVVCLETVTIVDETSVSNFAAIIL